MDGPDAFPRRTAKVSFQREVCVYGGGGVEGAVGLKQEVILRSSKNVTTEVGPPGPPNRFAISS